MTSEHEAEVSPLIRLVAVQPDREYLQAEAQERRKKVVDIKDTRSSGGFVEDKNLSVCAIAIMLYDFLSFVTRYQYNRTGVIVEYTSCTTLKYSMSIPLKSLPFHL